jgi:hypothetical protein
MAPLLLSPIEWAYFAPIFATVDYISVEAADHIAMLVKLYPTTMAYETNGGISSTGKLVSRDPSWSINTDYKKYMQKIVKRYKVSLRMCIRIDQSFRIKRARGGHVNVCDTIGNKTRVVVWYGCKDPAMGALMGAWFDITLREEAVDRNLYATSASRQERTEQMAHLKTELQENLRLVRVCAACRKQDSKEADHHKRCSLCLIPAYCSRACQKAHWKESHKRMCVRTYAVTT